MFSFLKSKPASIEDSACFKITQDGYGKFFVKERTTPNENWWHSVGIEPGGYDKIEHAEMAIKELLEYRTKSVQKVVAYYV